MYLHRLLHENLCLCCIALFFSAPGLGKQIV
jgi:hypothetical protein